MGYYERHRANRCGWRQIFHLFALLLVPLALSKLVKASPSSHRARVTNGVCSSWAKIANDDIVDFTLSTFDSEMNPIGSEVENRLVYLSQDTLDPALRDNVIGMCPGDVKTFAKPDDDEMMYKVKITKVHDPRSMFRKLDIDRNHMIDRFEMKAYVLGKEEGSSSGPSQEYIEALQHEAYTWAVGDTDKDGEISIEEFKALCESLLRPDDDYD